MTEELSPRFEMNWLHTFFPVRAWNAWTPPSPPPKSTSFSPLITAMTGVFCGASVGTPPVGALQFNSPVSLLNAKMSAGRWNRRLTIRP